MLHKCISVNIYACFLNMRKELCLKKWEWENLCSEQLVNSKVHIWTRLVSSLNLIFLSFLVFCYGGSFTIIIEGFIALWMTGKRFVINAFFCNSIYICIFKISVLSNQQKLVLLRSIDVPTKFAHLYHFIIIST